MTAKNTGFEEELWQWFAENIDPELDKLPVLYPPYPCCGLAYAEEGTTCDHCFVYRGRGHSKCEKGT